MKSVKKFFIALLVCVMGTSSIQVRAADVSETVSNITPLGRKWITGEDLGTAIVGTPKLRSTVGSNVVITPGLNIYYGSWVTCKFTMTTETGSYLGFCAEPNSDTPSGTFQVSKLDNKVIEGLVLTYVIPELWNKIGVNFYTPGYEYVFCHAAIGYVYSGSLTGLSSQAANGIKAIVADITNIINGTNGYAGSEKTILLNQYLKDYELHIAYNSEQDIVWAEKAPDVETSLALTKKQVDTEVCLSGAVFEHTKPDGTKESLTTDTNGQIFISKLSYGSHSLQESKAPEGYLLNEVIINFQVDKYGTITVSSQSELQEQGVRFAITSESETKKNISIMVSDNPVPYNLKIHKTNQNQIQLEGAEYGIYLEEACVNEFARGMTDAEGNLTFEGLLPQVNYYLKEKTAPLGYRLPVDEEGNTPVTEIRVVSVPMQGFLELYINGEKQDFQADSRFSLAGTILQPEIAITEINEAGYRLPETGSVQSLFLVTVAIIIFAIGLLGDKYYKNRRRQKEYENKNI